MIELITAQGVEGAKNNSSFKNFVGNIKQPNACNG
jgi:hypothetical protein